MEDPARGAPPAIAAIHHLTLPVDDLEVAERFYVGALGLPLVRRIDEATFRRLRPERAAEVDLDADDSPLHLQLRCGDVELDLFLRRAPNDAPLRAHPHLALSIAPQALAPFKERLTALGVPVDGPRRLGPPGHASIYFADPFGNLLELCTMGYEGPLEIGAPAVAGLGYRFAASPEVTS